MLQREVGIIELLIEMFKKAALTLICEFMPWLHDQKESIEKVILTLCFHFLIASGMACLIKSTLKSRATNIMCPINFKEILAAAKY